MSVQSNIKAQMIEAMKAKDAVRLSVIRGLLSAFTNEAVARGKKPEEELTDDEALAVISRQARQRKDSIEQFEKGGRADLAESERQELSILESYLPEQMSEAEVEKFVRGRLEGRAIEKDAKGKFIGEMMKDLKGKAEGSVVKAVVDRLIP